MAELQEFTFGPNDDVKWTTDTTTFPQTLNTEADVRGMFQTQPDMIQTYLNNQVVPAVNGKLEKSGGTMTAPIDMGGSKITNVGTPTANADAATKKYVDDGLAEKQDALTFDTAPTASSTNPVESGGVYTALAGKLDKTGGTMSGNIAMGGNKITGLDAPTADMDAATKKYIDDLVIAVGAGDMLKIVYDNSGSVETAGGIAEYVAANHQDISGKLNTSGGTMTGNLAMGGNLITGLGTPMNDADAATKKYVDDAVASAKSELEVEINDVAAQVVPFVAGSTAPTNTNKLWIDTTATTGGLKYYNGSAWVHVPVAYT